MGLEEKPLGVGRGVDVVWPVGLLILMGRLTETEVRAGVDRMPSSRSALVGRGDSVGVTIEATREGPRVPRGVPIGGVTIGGVTIVVTREGPRGVPRRVPGGVSIGGVITGGTGGVSR